LQGVAIGGGDLEALDGFAVQANLGLNLVVADLFGVDLNLHVVVAGFQKCLVARVSFAIQCATAVRFLTGATADAQPLQANVLR
jgi:hypothetical protein